MTSARTASGRARSSLLLAAGTATVAWVVTLLAGWAILPVADSAMGASAIPSVDQIQGSQALVAISGAHDETFMLDRVSVSRYNDDATNLDVIDLGLIFRDESISVGITGRDVVVGVPNQGDGIEAVLAIDGGNYFANSGECTVEIASIESVVLEPLPAVRVGIPRGVPIPAYAGTIICLDVEELGSDQSVTIHAAFQYRPDTDP